MPFDIDVSDADYRVHPVDDRANYEVARDIVRLHTQAELDEILLTADPRIAESIRAYLARHGSRS